MDRSVYARIIEAARDHAALDEAWLRGLLVALRPVLDRGLGVIGFLYALHERPAVRLGVDLGAPAAAIVRLQSPSGQLDGDVPRAAMSAGIVTTFRAPPGAGALAHVPGAAAIGEPIEDPIVDGLALYCLDVDGHGLGIVAYSPALVQLSRRERQRLERVVAGLNAAFRVRRRGGATGAALASPEAVSPAERPARSQRARESLRAAAVARDRARVRGSDADDTLDLHQALVAGRWSLVDSFEREGKRYLIARHNTAAPAVPELSVRETQVAVFAAMGHALKMIAYELGVSESCVATYLRRALVKLGLPDRIALTRRFAGLRTSPGSTPAE